MKPLIIHKSRRKTARNLIASCIILGFFVYNFLTDTTKYPRGNSFYWVAIVLFGFTTLYFIFDILDKTPLYILTDNGIYRGTDKEIIRWADLSTFECKSPYQKYITPKLAILYDKTGSEAYTIDFTHTDITLERMEKILKRKLKAK